MTHRMFDDEHDLFEDALSVLVDLIGSNAPDHLIDLRARSIEMAFGPKADDVMALAMSDIAMEQHAQTRDFLRVFPDFCQRR